MAQPQFLLHTGKPLIYRAHSDINRIPTFGLQVISHKYIFTKTINKVIAAHIYNTEAKTSKRIICLEKKAVQRLIVAFIFF